MDENTRRDELRRGEADAGAGLDVSQVNVKGAPTTAHDWTEVASNNVPVSQSLERRNNRPITGAVMSKANLR
jgi:hypothetical protein